MSTSQAGPNDVGYILLAEDNPADVGLIHMALASHGIRAEVHVVSDGEAALHFIASLDEDESASCPIIALVDLNLPRVSGSQVLRSLRSIRRCEHVPVIVMSSSLSSRDREETLALGAAAYFSKPSGLELFLELGALVKSLIPDAPDLVSPD